jgi:hypothetical protein
MARRALVGSFLVVAIAAACGEIAEPEGFSVPSSTAEVASSGELVLAEPVTTSPSTPPTSADFVPRPEEGYVPEVLISTEQQVLLASAERTQPLDGSLAGVGSTHAVDDLLGGLVIQRSSAGAAGDIIWLSAEREEPQTVDEDGAELLDVGYVGGSPYAVVLVGGTQVDGIRLVDNERTPVVTLDDGEEVLDLSASAGLNAIAIENEMCGDLRFYRSDGTRLELGGPVEPDCIVPHRPAYGAVALSPDGGALLYTVVSYRDDGIEVATDLVARNLSTGEDYFRHRIGEDGERIAALSFDGDRAAYLRESFDGSSVTVLDLTDEALETPIGLLGATSVNSVAFTRLSVATGA